MDFKIIFVLLLITLCTASRRHYARRLLFGSRRPLYSIGRYGGRGGVLFDDGGPSNDIRPPAWDSPLIASWRPVNTEYAQPRYGPGKSRRPRDLREDYNRLQNEKLDRRLSWVSFGLEAANRFRRRPRTIANNVLGRPINSLYGGLQSTLTNTLGQTLDPVFSVFQRVPLFQNQFLRPVYNRGDFDGDDDSDESSSEESDSGSDASSDEEGFGRQPWSESNESSESETNEEDKSIVAEAGEKEEIDATNSVVVGEGNAGETNILSEDAEREAPQSEVS